jgi:hypothetical protein
MKTADVKTGRHWHVIELKMTEWTPVIRKHLESAYLSAFGRKLTKNMAPRPDDDTFVLKYGDTPVGFCQVRTAPLGGKCFDKTRPYLYNLCVTAKLQKKGGGTVMMKYVETKYRELNTHLSNESDALAIGAKPEVVIKMFEKRDWKRKNIWKQYYEYVFDDTVERSANEPQVTDYPPNYDPVEGVVYMD